MENALEAEARLFSELRRLRDTCTEAGVRFAAIGGIALSGYLRRNTRLTVDIDLVVAQENGERFRDLLTELGYVCGTQDLWLRARKKVEETEVVVDVTSEEVTDARSFYSYRIPLPETGGTALLMPFHTELAPMACEVPVASPEDLLVLKLLAGRDRDLLDVLALLLERSDAIDSQAFCQRVALADLDIPIASALARLRDGVATGDLLQLWIGRTGEILGPEAVQKVLACVEALTP